MANQQNSQQLSTDPFAQVENEVAWLRQQVAEGRIAEQQAKERLEQLTVKDDTGALWTVGFKTGVWYRWDGSTWVQASPPRRQSDPITPPPPELPSTPVASRPASVDVAPDRLAARMKSYGGSAAWVFVLYWLFYLPGLVVNYIFYKEAKRMEQVAQQKLPGVGCLSFMLWFNIILLIVAVVAVVVVVVFGVLSQGGF